MNVTGSRAARWGCGALVLGAALVAGTLTWYSYRLSGSYRQVKQSEQALVAATQAPSAWAPPADGVPAPDRLEAFAGVRESLAEWRQRLATEERQVAGRGGWWARAGGASDLAQTMAEFWVARNDTLRAASMGPGEYTWLYGLVYYGWLGHDPAAGGPGGPAAGGAATGGASGPAGERFAQWRRLWQGGVGGEAAAALTPLRARLEAGWTEETNPVELMFVADEPSASGR